MCNKIQCAGVRPCSQSRAKSTSTHTPPCTYTTHVADSRERDRGSACNSYDLHGRWRAARKQRQAGADASAAAEAFTRARAAVARSRLPVGERPLDTRAQPVEGSSRRSPSRAVVGKPCPVASPICARVRGGTRCTSAWAAVSARARAAPRAERLAQTHRNARNHSRDDGEGSMTLRSTSGVGAPARALREVYGRGTVLVGDRRWRGCGLRGRAAVPLLLE